MSSRSLLLITTLLVAQVAGAAVGRDLQRENFRSSICNIESMTVSFRIDESFGEPVITSKVKWRAGPNTANDCLSRLTNVWVKVRTPQDAVRYLKLSPDIMRAGEDFGPLASEAPSWATLFCDTPSESSRCEGILDAKAMLGVDLRFESFEVVTDSRTLTSLGSSSQQPSRSSDKSVDRKSSGDLDSLLAQAIDTALAPEIKAEQRSSITPEQLAQERKAQRESLARDAVNNVVTLIASTLAQYSTPAHGCESDRTVANWVQARGTCQLNFRSEANHEFLCSDDGKSTLVRATRQANINLAKDLNKVGPIRISNEGWASVVLELHDELRTTTEGNYKMNRWQFTASSDHVEDLKQLAGSILTLKEYCETSGATQSD